MTAAIAMMPAVDLDTGRLVDVPIDPDIRQHPRSYWQRAALSKRRRDVRSCQRIEGYEDQLRRRWVNVTYRPDATHPVIELHFGGGEATELEVSGPVPPYALGVVLKYVAEEARGHWWQFHRKYGDDQIKRGMTLTWTTKRLTEIEAER